MSHMEHPDTMRHERDRLVLEAMREELGNKRLDTLPLQNRRDRGPSYVPGNRQRAVPRPVNNAMANAWHAAIRDGDFDDSEAQAVKNLDDLGGARVYATGPKTDIQKQSSQHLEVFTAFPQQRSLADGGRRNAISIRQPVTGSFNLGKHKVGKLGGIVPDGGVVVTFPKFKPPVQERTGIHVQPKFPATPQRRPQPPPPHGTRLAESEPRTRPGTPQTTTLRQQPASTPSLPIRLRPSLLAATIPTPVQTPASKQFTQALAGNKPSFWLPTAAKTAQPGKSQHHSAAAVNDLIDFQAEHPVAIRAIQQNVAEAAALAVPSPAATPEPEPKPRSKLEEATTSELTITVVCESKCHLLQLGVEKVEEDGGVVLKSVIGVDLEDALFEIWIKGELVAQQSLRYLMGIRRNKRIVGIVFDVNGGQRYVLHFDLSEEAIDKFVQIVRGMQESLAEADRARVPADEVETLSGPTIASDTNGTGSSSSVAAADEQNIHLPDFVRHFTSLLGMLSTNDHKKASQWLELTQGATCSEQARMGMSSIRNSREQPNAVDMSLLAANYRATVVSLTHVVPYLRMMDSDGYGH